MAGVRSVGLMTGGLIALALGIVALIFSTKVVGWAFVFAGFVSLSLGQFLVFREACDQRDEARKARDQAIKERDEARSADTASVKLFDRIDGLSMNRVNVNVNTGNRPVATDPSLLKYADREIALSDLVTTFPAVITGRTFTNCKLVGPAGVVFLDGCELDGPIFEADAASVEDLLLVTTKTTVHGAIAFSRCKFQECTWFAVDLIVDAAGAERFKRALRRGKGE